MKNTNVKKIAAILVATTICLNIAGIVATANQPKSIPDIGVVSPMNIAITEIDNNLYIYSSGGLACYGATYTKSPYLSSVTVELQQQNGGWSTIKTWSQNGSRFSIVDEIYHPPKKYNYRLKLTHEAYSINNILVESFTEYSDIVSY